MTKPLDPGPAGSGPPSRAPRWVKILAVVAGVLVLVIVVHQLIGGGGHGPGRHLPGGLGAPAATSANESTPSR